MRLRTIALFVTLALGLLAAPLPAGAQQPGKVYRLGWLAPLPPAASAFWVHMRDAFLSELRDLGWVEERNLVIEYRPPRPEFRDLDALATELVGLEPDVILAAPSAVARAARRATTTIPIVFAIVSDPIGDGLVQSLARPGGNATGMANVMLDFAPKTLELLTEAVPGVRRVAYLWNPVHGQVAFKAFEAIRAAAEGLNVGLQSVQVQAADDFDAAFSAMLRQRTEAFVMMSDPLMATNKARIADFALANRLPSAAAGSAGYWPEAGGLMGYQPSYTDMFRRAAHLVDKILRGARPADLPVERPTKFELRINLKTAKALGLTIPDSLLFRADRVIK